MESTIFNMRACCTTLALVSVLGCRMRWVQERNLILSGVLILGREISVSHEISYLRRMSVSVETSMNKHL